MSDIQVGFLIFFSIFSITTVVYFRNKQHTLGASILRSMNREDLIPKLSRSMTDISLFNPKNARKKRITKKDTMEIGDVYKHFKGGYYKILGFPINCETGEDCIFYEDVKGKTWVRSCRDFNKPALSIHGETQRFTEVTCDDLHNPFKKTGGCSD